MHGELAQVIALVAHGNRFLKGPAGDARLESTNSTFQYVASVGFEYSTGGPAERVAESTNGWFSWLRNRGVRRLNLRTLRGTGPLPGHVAVAFAGAGTWVVVHESGEGSEYWRAAWQVDRPGDRKPWRVLYLGQPSKARWPLREMPLDQARDDLSHALDDAREIAIALGANDWAQWFAQATEQMTAPNPVARFHDDALPSGYSFPARQLYSAAVGSWVFGGMGSWNDMYVEEPTLKKRYDQVSDALFVAILQAFEAVLDSWQP